jgi:hypothetical protein
MIGGRPIALSAKNAYSVTCDHVGMADLMRHKFSIKGLWVARKCCESRNWRKTCGLWYACRIGYPLSARGPYSTREKARSEAARGNAKAKKNAVYMELYFYFSIDEIFHPGGLKMPYTKRPYYEFPRSHQVLGCTPPPLKRLDMRLMA